MVIVDPIERLRFLRRCAEPGSKRGVGKKRALAAASASLVVGTVAVLAAASLDSAPAPVALPVAAVVASDPERPAEVWQIESTNGSDLYSNGLRVEKVYSTENRPRSYTAYSLNADGNCEERRSEPAGIVFHTTESPQLPFDPRHSKRLDLMGKSLLDYVQSKRAYNFVIDRFGRVHQVVVESDAANHAGHSVWADEQTLYVNLNDSFLGVSFEALTEPGQVASKLTAPQLRSAQALTEMLRSRYAIAAVNCVTHAQVSVNPANMRVGYHTDWASGFPFKGVGLPDNYALPLPAIWAFGFEYDPAFLRATGSRMHTGVALAEERVRLAAEAASASVSEYRKELKRRYRSPGQCGAGLIRKGETT